MERMRLAIFGSIPFLLVKHLRVTGKVAMDEAVPKLTRSASVMFEKKRRGLLRVNKRKEIRRRRTRTSSPTIKLFGTKAHIPELIGTGTKKLCGNRISCTCLWNSYRCSYRYNNIQVQEQLQ